MIHQINNSSTLHELIQQDSRCKALYENLPRDVQVALQEQRQNIRSYDELAKAAEGFQKRSHQ